MRHRSLRVEPLVSGTVQRSVTGRLRVETSGPGFTEVTAAVGAFLADSGIESGLAIVFCRHSSASLIINENADPDVRIDLATALDRLAPRNGGYIHGAEGPDDMPAHIRSVLTGASVAVPILEGRLALGTWQGIYLAEHRDRPHTRELLINLSGW